MPGERVLYLGQISEEVLRQRFGLFSYWRASSPDQKHMRPILDALNTLEQKQAQPGLVLLRD
jgi:hypothetical protein